jgi:hypothetical protein
MTGLDPGIDEAVRKTKSVRLVSWMLIMDCRVKPGNDSW